MAFGDDEIIRRLLSKYLESLPQKAKDAAAEDAESRTAREPAKLVPGMLAKHLASLRRDKLSRAIQHPDLASASPKVERIIRMLMNLEKPWDKS